MYYERFNDFTKEYRPGVSKISRSKCEIGLDKNYSLITKKYSGNYFLYFSKKGLLISLIEYKFDSQNRITKAIRYIYTYTKDQSIAIIIGNDLLTHVLTHKFEFSYNADNQIEEEYITEYLYTGEIMEATECNHEYKGNYHRMQEFDAIEEKEISVFETWYDAESGAVETKFSLHDGDVLNWTKQIYNKNGQLIREYEMNADGKVMDESEIFYQPQKTIKISYGPKKNVLETHTEYDDNRNWITKSYFENGELYCVEEQTVEYY